MEWRKSGEELAITKLEKIATPKTSPVTKLHFIKLIANRGLYLNEKEIARSQYGRYEKGEDLRYSSLLKVIRAFDITIEEFFKEGEGKISKISKMTNLKGRPFVFKKEMFLNKEEIDDLDDNDQVKNGLNEVEKEELPFPIL